VMVRDGKLSARNTVLIDMAAAAATRTTKSFFMSLPPSGLRKSQIMIAGVSALRRRTPFQGFENSRFCA
jgi:hypothetical protein